MRHAAITFLLFLLSFSILRSQDLKPKIENGIWNVSFMYWSSLSPAVEGTGGMTILCKVVELGDEEPEARRFQSGRLKVIELLSSSAKELLALKIIKLDGCEGLKLNDHVIVCIGGEVMPNGSSVYCVMNHRGTNCQIGHRLSLQDEQGHDEEANKALIELAKKGFPSVNKLSPDELRAFSVMDPDGVREALIRKIEIKKLQNNTQ